MCVYVELEQTASDLRDIKYANVKVTDWEGKLQKRNGKTTSSQTQHTFCNSIYTFYHSSISFPYKLYTCTERSDWNRQFLRLSLGRLGRHKFLQKQVELQIHEQWKFSNKNRMFAANFFKSGNTKKRLCMVTANRVAHWTYITNCTVTVCTGVFWQQHIVLQ